VVAAKEAAPTQRRILMARLTDTQLTWPESDLAAPTDAIYQPQHPILY
jgi:hypothetical protein